MKRSDHNAACPCNFCTAHDADAYRQYRKAMNYQRLGDAKMMGIPDDVTYRNMELFLTTERNRNLNWNFEPGHCILCGGVDHGKNLDHYLLARHNEKQVGDRWYTSLLLHKFGHYIGVYRNMLMGQKFSQAKLINWCTLFLELNPEKCVVLAAKEHDEWVEIRLGFTELQEEDYDARVERTRPDRTTYRGKNRSGIDQATGQGGGAFQGQASVAG